MPCHILLQHSVQTGRGVNPTRLPWTVALLSTALLLAASCSGDVADVEDVFAPLLSRHDPGPLRPRYGVGLVVLDDGAVALWGGEVDPANSGLPGPASLFSDGAVYSPQTRSWTTMADAAGVFTSLQVPYLGVLGDKEIYWFSGTEFAAWNYETGGWRSLASAPVDVPDAIWDGRYVVATDGTVRYDPVTDEWNRLPPAPIGTFLTKLVLIDGTLVAAHAGYNLLALSILDSDDNWKILATKELGGSWNDFHVAAHMDVIYIVTSSGRTLTYSLGSESWTDVQRLPIPAVPRFSDLVSTDVGPVWFGGGTAVLLSAFPLTPIPNWGWTPNTSGGSTDVWGHGLSSGEPTLLSFAADEARNPRFIGWGNFSFDTIGLHVSISPQSLASMRLHHPVEVHSSAIELDVLHPEGSCIIDLLPSFHPELKVLTDLSCSDDDLAKEIGSRMVIRDGGLNALIR